MRLLTGLLAQFGKVFGKVVITYPALAVLVGDLIAGDRDADQGGGHWNAVRYCRVFVVGSRERYGHGSVGLVLR